MFFQVGIINEASSCAEANYPHVYTRLSHYRRWIESILSNPEPTPAPPSITYKCDRRAVSCGCSLYPVAFTSSRIVGGAEAVPFSWSMIVSIRFGLLDGHSCAGTILDAAHILTAAHCVDDEAPDSPIDSDSLVHLVKSIALPSIHVGMLLRPVMCTTSPFYTCPSH